MVSPCSLVLLVFLLILSCSFTLAQTVFMAQMAQITQIRRLTSASRAAACATALDVASAGRDCWLQILFPLLTKIGCFTAVTFEFCESCLLVSEVTSVRTAFAWLRPFLLSAVTCPRLASGVTGLLAYEVTCPRLASRVTGLLASEVTSPLLKSGETGPQGLASWETLGVHWVCIER